MMRHLFLLLFVAATTAYPALGQDKIAIVNVTIIDGNDHPPRTNSTVIVQRTKIVAITGEREKPPRGAKIVDGTGRFLIPGLWNNDLHGGSYDDAKSHLPELVSYGITTVRDMGAPLNDILRLRDSIATGALVGPRLFVAGPLMEGPVPAQMPLIVDLFSEKQARNKVKDLKQHNVDYVEVDTSLTPELYWAIADEAERQGLPLVGHIPATIAAGEVVNAKQRDVEHLGGRFLNVLIACSSDEAFFNQVIGKTYDDLLIAMKEKRPANEPQFKADFDERLLKTFDESKAQRLYRLYAKNGVAQTPTLYVLKTLWQSNKDDLKLNEQDMQSGKRIFAKDHEIVGEMKLAGITILAGTDGPYEQGGDALHSELELLVEAGLTPLQALQAASRDAAKEMGVSKDVGTIEAGKVADLVLLDADPLANIANTRKIDAVVLRGQLFSREEFSSMRNH
jgi:imidazolonepropionase-like amidohydrolase